MGECHDYFSFVLHLFLRHDSKLDYSIILFDNPQGMQYFIKLFTQLTYYFPIYQKAGLAQYTVKSLQMDQADLSKGKFLASLLLPSFFIQFPQPFLYPIFLELCVIVFGLQDDRVQLFSQNFVSLKCLRTFRDILLDLEHINELASDK